MPSRINKNRDRRGSVENPAEPRFLVVGQVLKPHGVRGEVRVRPHTDEPERFTWLETVYVGEKNPQPVAVTAARLHQGLVLLKLEGIDDRDAAQALRGAWLQVAIEDALPLAEGEYYLYQFIGLQVFTDEDELLGELADVIETGANYVFVVQGTRGELLLPNTDEVVQQIDLENGRMVIHLLPGLL